MTLTNTQTVAVIGAGVAGTVCARALLAAGRSVHLFDKSRGPGGRLATRRVEWIDRTGRTCVARFDHGAIGISVHSAAFQAFIDSAVLEGWLTEWKPKLATRSVPLADDAPIYLPVPDMPALCRQLSDGVPATWSFAVDELRKSPRGWQLASSGECFAGYFDAIVLALPPAQAAALLSRHRSDWTRHALAARMQPCWTLMGIADELEPALDWTLARPPTGPLAWVLRNDSRPGRARTPGQSQWVVHARADWSEQHLEHPPASIEQQMRAALDEWLGRPLRWQHNLVHRWRYALPEAPINPGSATCWWDAEQSLGVCGDFLGGAGVEGAWLSAQSLGAAMLQHSPDAGDRVA